MRGARLLLVGLAALAVGACARQQPAYYVMDPNTGQPVPVVTQQQFGQQAYAQQTAAQPAASSNGQGSSRGLFSSSSFGSPFGGQDAYAQQGYAPQQPPPPSGRGLFNSRMSAPQP